MFLRSTFRETVLLLLAADAAITTKHTGVALPLGYKMSNDRDSLRGSENELDGTAVVPNAYHRTTTTTTTTTVLEVDTSIDDDDFVSGNTSDSVVLSTPPRYSNDDTLGRLEQTNRSFDNDDMVNYIQSDDDHYIHQPFLNEDDDEDDSDVDLSRNENLYTDIMVER